MFLQKYIDNMRYVLLLKRRQLKWSQTKTAIECMVSSAMISKFEEKKVKDMRLTTFLRICMVFNVSPNDMLLWKNVYHEVPEPQEKPSPYFLNHTFDKLLVA